MTDLLCQQRPKLGWICSYTPIEIPWAAGYLPIRLSGGEKLPRSQDPRIYHLLCPFIRAVFHRYSAMQGQAPEAVTFVRCCDGMVRLHQSNGALQVIRDRLQAAGFRLINLEADLSDPTNFPAERIRDQLLTHLEVLGARRTD